MSATVLEMRDIRKTFGATHALSGVSFSVEKGEVHMLLGENGAGKSTLMKILAGSLKADSGEIYWEGKKVDIENPAMAHKLGIGMVYQELALVETMNVMENVLMGNLPTKANAQYIDWKAARARATKLLERVGLQDVGLSHSKPSQSKHGGYGIR